MTADRLTLAEVAERYGVHAQSVRKRLGAGDFPNATKDQRGRWLLDPAEVEAVTGWPPRGDPGSTRTGPVEQPSPLVLLDQLAPLLQRIANAERERADAEAAARIAEHRADAAAAAAEDAEHRAEVAEAAAAAAAERADAAEHRADDAEQRAEVAEAARTAPAPVRVPAWIVAALVAGGVLLGALVVALVVAAIG